MRTKHESIVINGVKGGNGEMLLSAHLTDPKSSSGSPYGTRAHLRRRQLGTLRRPPDHLRAHRNRHPPCLCSRTRSSPCSPTTSSSRKSSELRTSAKDGLRAGNVRQQEKDAEVRQEHRVEDPPKNKTRLALAIAAKAEPHKVLSSGRIQVHPPATAGEPDEHF